MTRFLSTLCAASALALTVGAADAATVTITGITGTWVDTDPNQTWQNSISGTGTSQIRWGTPSSGSDKSGYNFNKAATSFTAAQDDEFKLGQFEHLNYPITGTSITAATLQVVFSFMLEGETTARQLTSKFLFAHNETTNNENPCANGASNYSDVNANGCADQVTVSTLVDGSETIELVDEDGSTREYAFDILGFKQGGMTINEFWTVEKQKNSADLYARFTYAENINVPPVAPVPLPAAGFLLLGGLGAMGAVARRRKSA